MRLTKHAHGDVTVITLDGALDSASANDVREQLERLMPGSGTTVLDLGKMTYMSSAGLRVVLLAHRRAQRSGAHIVLARLVPEVREVMSATGFLDFFEVASEFDAEAFT